jgi:hypothetical protein
LDGYIDFPSEAVVEDTSRLRDKLPEVPSEQGIDLVEAESQSDSKKADPSHSTDRGPNDPKKEQGGDLHPSAGAQPQIGQIKTSEDLRKTLDSFFE